MIIDIGARTGSIAKGEGQITAFPLKLKDYHKVLRFLNKSIPKDENGMILSDSLSAGMGILATEGLEAIFTEIFPVYIKEFSGLQIQENGQLREALIQDLWTYGMLAPIGLEILMFIFGISNLTDTEKKK